MPHRSIFNNISAHADGERRGLDRIGRVASERSRRRRVFRHPQIDAGRRRLPSACAEGLKKKRRSRMKDGSDRPRGDAVPRWRCGSRRAPGRTFNIVGACRRRTPGDPWSIQKVPEDASHRDLSDTTLQFDETPRCSPSACAKMLLKTGVKNRCCRRAPGRKDASKSFARMHARVRKCK